MTIRSAAAEAHIVVRGRVQGVYFRGSLKQQADMRGLSGWVRNRPDGSVEAVVQGPRAAVDSVVAWAQRGPRGARVESAEVHWPEVEALLDTFEVVS